MKKGKKRLIIGAVAVIAVAGVVAVAGQPGTQDEQIPQVQVLSAELGDVEQMVDASGTVASDEQKTFFSPVNAQIQKLTFEEGDTVKAGTKLVEFNVENLEKDNEKAELNLKSGKYDYSNAVKKSKKAVKKQSEAKDNVKTLEQKVKEQKDYVASLKTQLAQVNAQAQRDAQADARQQAARQQAEAQAKEEEMRRKQEEKNQEIQRAYYEALTTYQNETLPDYQRELGQLNSRANQALSAYNQAETTYQMAFAQWELDQSEENSQALSDADQARSDAQISYQQAKDEYENMKNQAPQMPVMSDFANQTDYGDFVSDGTSDADLSDEPDADASANTSANTSVNTSGEGGGSYVAPDTSAIENALEQASSDLAELQSDLASEKAMAEADSSSLTKEEKEKMNITNNLSELDVKSVEELVEEGKKGIIAEFNGVISKSAVQEGLTVTQGMELFTLQNTDKVNVDINISKYDYDKVKEGQKAEITMADRTYQGTVTKVSHIAVPNEKGTPMISAEVRINDPNEDIFLGVDAKVKIHAATANGVLTLPVEVVNIGKEGSFCYVIEDGIVARRNITTGLSSDTLVEVKEGLSADDQVIVDLGVLEEGMPVKALGETEGANEAEGVNEAEGTSEAEGASEADSAGETEEGTGETGAGADE